MAFTQKHAPVNLTSIPSLDDRTIADAIKHIEPFPVEHCEQALVYHIQDAVVKFRAEDEGAETESFHSILLDYLDVHAPHYQAKNIPEEIVQNLPDCGRTFSKMVIGPYVPGRLIDDLPESLSRKCITLARNTLYVPCTIIGITDINYRNVHYYNKEIIPFDFNQRLKPSEPSFAREFEYIAAPYSGNIFVRKNTQRDYRNFEEQCDAILQRLETKPFPSAALEFNANIQSEIMTHTLELKEHCAWKTKLSRRQFERESLYY